MDEFCGRVMPYLKLDVTDDTGPVVELSHDDSPVLRNLGNGLLVAYIVDAGQSSNTFRTDIYQKPRPLRMCCTLQP
jgi:hypothetical protein